MITVNGRSYAAARAPTVVVCVDGCEPDYIAQAVAHGHVPWLKEVLATGTSLVADCVVPSFTNPNNLSIVTGVPPAVHGLPGNHYLDPTGAEVQLVDPAQLRAPSIHARAAEAGVRVLAVTTKDKLRRLLAAGGVPCVSAEKAHEQSLDGIADLPALVGRPNPGIYDWDCSHYALELGQVWHQPAGEGVVEVGRVEAVEAHHRGRRGGAPVAPAVGLDHPGTIVAAE